MKPIEVKPGTKYGELTVVREAALLGKRKFVCKCSCGSSVTVRLDHLRSGHTSTCGECGIEHGGKRLTIKEWAESHGIKESTLRARLKKMNLREALDRK
jgi:hypothetical protein